MYTYSHRMDFLRFRIGSDRVNALTNCSRRIYSLFLVPLSYILSVRFVAGVGHQKTVVRYFLAFP